MRMIPCFSRICAGFCTIALFFLFQTSIQAQVDIVTEGFETDGEATRYVSTSFNDGSCNFFNRTNDNAPNACYLNVIGNVQGSWFWASEDIDEPTNSSSPIANLTLNPAVVTGFSSLEVRVFLAVGRPGLANSVWELDDFVRIQYQMDGGGYQTIGQFVGNMQFGGDLVQDADLNGVADPAGAIITTTLTEYTFTIPVTGNSLSVRINLDGHDGSEEFIFDQIRIRGVMTVNMAPVLANIEGSTIMYTEGDPAVQVTNTITASDADDVNLESATVSIATNFASGEDVLAATPVGGIIQSYNGMTGILTLSGTASIANYQATLRSVTYLNSNTTNPSTLTRTVRFQVNDGESGSNLQNRNIAIEPVVNDPAMLPYCESFETAGEGTRYTSNSYNEQPGNCDFFYRTNATPVCFAEAVSGSNGSWYWASEDVVGTGSGNLPGTVSLAPLIATGLADFDIEVLLAVTTPSGSGWETDDNLLIQYNMDGGAWVTVGAFYGTNDGDINNQPGQLVQDADLNGIADPAGMALTNTFQNFTFSFNSSGTNLNVRIVVDQDGGTEELAFDNICVSGAVAQAAPILANIEMPAIDYTEGDGPVQVSNTITVTDVDDTMLESARIWICTGYTPGEDELTYTSFGGVTGSFNPGTGELNLTGSATLADYQSVLRSVTYENTNLANPANHQRMVCFQVNDGDASSNVVSRAINVMELLDGPACMPYTESFETDGEGVRYASNSYDDQPVDCDFFIRVNAQPACHGDAVTGADGSWFWASEDVISPGNGNMPGTVTTQEVDVTDWTSLNVSLFIGTSNDASGGVWEINDLVSVEYRMDGGSWDPVGLFKVDTVLGSLREDLDLNPLTEGPYGTVVPNGSYGDFSFAIPTTGNLLEVRVIVDQDGGTEELAFDNIRIDGTFNGMNPMLVCPADFGPVECPAGFNMSPVGMNTPQDPAVDTMITGVPEGIAGSCPEATLSFQDALTGPFTDDCANGLWVVVRTWTLVDASDNVSSCTQTISISDTTQPMITCPGDVSDIPWPSNFNTTAVGPNTPQDPILDPSITGIPVNSDNCGIADTSYQDVLIGMGPDFCPDEVTVERTWTVTDLCGLQAMCTQTFTFSDTTAPVITCPGDQMGFLDDDCNNSIPDFTGLLQVTENCGFTITQTPMPGTQISGHGTSQLISMSVLDDTGNSANCSFNYTVSDTTPPNAICLDITVDIDPQSESVIVFADDVNNNSTDNCGIIGLSSSPALFTCSNVGLNIVTLTVTDIAGNTASCTAMVTITDSFGVCCEPPDAVCQDITVFLDGAGNVFITPSDVDGGTTADCGFASTSVNPNSFTCADIGANAVSFAVTDSAGNSAFCSAIVTVQDTTAPVFDNLPMMLPDINCDDPLHMQEVLTASDNCGSAEVMPASSIGGSVCAGFLVTHSWTATDGSGNSTTVEISYNVLPDTTAPVATFIPPDVTLECDDDVAEELSALPIFMDNCDPEVPALGSIEVVFDPNCPQGALYIQAWAGVDDCGNQTVVGRTVTVIDTTPPVLNDPENDGLPADMVLDCTDPVPPAAMLEATDNCGGGGGNIIFISEFHYDDESTDEGEFIEVSGTAGLDLSNYSLVLYNGSNGTVYDTDALVGTIDDEGMGFGAVSLSYPVNGIQNGAPDGIALVEGGTNVLEFISYEGSFAATNGPAMGMMSTDIGVNENGELPGLSLQRTGTGSQASDFSWTGPVAETPGTLNAGLTIEAAMGLLVQFNETILPGPCPQEDTIRREWFVDDGCGNTAMHVQIISFMDNEQPAFTLPADITINCEDNPFDLNLTGNVTDLVDNCDPNPSVMYQDNIDLDGCNMTGTITRSFIVTDACGNGTALAQVITVQDTTPPTFTPPMDVTLDCDDDYEDLTLTGDVEDAMDNCTGVSPTILWINEIHYDNSGTDAGEFIEVAGVAGLDLGNYSLVLYNGSNGLVYNTMALSGMIDDESNGFGALSFAYPVNGIQNGSPDGIALVDGSNFVLEFISYEGSFIAADGPAMGMMSMDIMASEAGSEPLGMSVQKTGSGNMPGDFNWTGPSAESPGSLNAGQTIEALPPVEEVDVAFSDETNLNDCGVGTVTRTWTVTDACGNSSQSTQEIIIMSVPPSSICMDITIELDQNGQAMVTPDLIDDGSFSICSEVTIMLSQTSFSCANIGVNMVTLTATDECGETMTCMAQITVVDNLAPTVFCPQDITLNLEDGECEEIANWSILAFDNCTDMPTITQISGPPSGSYFEANTTTLIEYSITDPSGNETLCSFNIIVVPYPFPLHALACNNLIQLSLDTNCQALVGPDLILEGGPYKCFNEYLVEVDGYEPAMGGVMLDGSAAGQTLGVTITDPATGISCWGAVSIEDKLSPVLQCFAATVLCPESTDPIFTEPVQGTAMASTSPASQIGPNAATVTSQDLEITTPAVAIVTDVNITIDLDHTFSGDLDVFLIGPDGTMVELATDVCGGGDNWDMVTFDDEAGTLVTAACVGGPPALSGSVQPEGSLATFDGLTAGGTWTLQITDDAGGDQGVLNSVTLEVNYFVVAPYAPIAMDNCDEDVDLSYTDSLSGDECDVLTITRTWVGTDDSGNTGTCVQIIEILPLNLDNLACPPTYTGECGTSTSPGVTGLPTVSGFTIPEGGLCNIFVTYWDTELNDCGGGTKIVRAWTVLDWCNQRVEECTQILKLEDNEGPELTCPEDLTVGTDPWFCNTDVVIPQPTATDACGTPFTLSFDAGPLQGQVSGTAPFFVLNDVPVGEHILTWIATDACGNSSTCTFTLTVEDDIPPVASCDEHTIVSVIEDHLFDRGLTKIPATTLDDGSYDNCGPVTFRARRMDSCIDFDWTTNGAGVDEIPNGFVDSRDRGTVHRELIPFACCDVHTTIMVELEVTDAAGNVNFCMVEVEVQDKLAPFITCPPDVTVSCEFWFAAAETAGFVPQEADQLTPVFGRILDAYEYDESDRQPIIIDDQGNTELPQPFNWGLDGWADDNCNVTIDVRVRLFEDCSGDDLPNPHPAGAVRLVERTFRATDDWGNVSTCRQLIWVVDFEPFFITDQTCNNPNPNDGVIWPCDREYTSCPDEIPVDYPTVFDDNCSILGVEYDDQTFYFVDNACYKIIRTWTVIDWCQYDQLTGEGYWQYQQVIKVVDSDGPEFVDCPAGPVTLCVENENVSLPANNQVFLGEDDPNATKCSVHVRLEHEVEEVCSDIVKYDVKVYPNNGSTYLQVVNLTELQLDSNNRATLVMDTKTSALLAIRQNGLPYNDRFCGNYPLPGGDKDYHRVLWTVEDGCGNVSTCEYLFRLEDCKKPSPVCINGISTVVMPSSGEVTIWAADFNASSFDDCTSSENLVFSFCASEICESAKFACDCEETTPDFPGQPCFDVDPNTGQSFVVEIWVADEGTDDNCDGQISWAERNKDFCTTFIVAEDNGNECQTTFPLTGFIFTEEDEPIEDVNVQLFDPSGTLLDTYVTEEDGLYQFVLSSPSQEVRIVPERLDNPKNGVSTLDLVRIQKHLLGIEILESPYKRIAADANNSASISALDMVELRKLILGIYSELPANDSWRFFAMQQEISDPYAPWPFEEAIEYNENYNGSFDFMGIKIGDLNGTAQANARQIEVRNAQGVLQIETDDREVQAGENIEVRFSAKGMRSVAGYQFTLDHGGLIYTGSGAGLTQLGAENVGLFEGALTASWNQREGLRVEDGETLFSLQFVAERSGLLSDMLKLGSEITEAEAYTGEEQIFDMALTFRNRIAPGQDFALYQNEPNPFGELTNISFTLPEAMEATLILFDVTGKEIRRIEGTYAGGLNEVEIKRWMLGSAGVVYYKLEAGQFTATKKMIVID